MGRSSDFGAGRTGCSIRPSGYVRSSQTQCLPHRKIKCRLRRSATRNRPGHESPNPRVAEHRRKRKAAMHDSRRAVSVNQQKRATARPGRGDRRESNSHSLGEKPQGRANVEAGSPCAWRRKATRRDRRALKGTKPHERRLAGPVDGLFIRRVRRRASAGPAMPGRVRSARNSGRGTRRRDARLNRMTRADTTIWKERRPRPCESLSGQANTPRKFASQFHPAAAKRGRAVDEAGDGLVDTRQRA